MEEPVAGPEGGEMGVAQAHRVVPPGGVIGRTQGPAVRGKVELDHCGAGKARARQDQ